MPEKPPELFNLNGRSAVVTGAGAGLGKTVATGLARHGADVAICDINEESLADTVECITSHGRQALGVRCDTSIPADVQTFFEEIDKTLGHVDILVNNVGIPARRHPEALSLEDWDKVLRTNMTSTFLCSQEAGRRMIERGQGGSIINVSSTASCTGMGRGNFVYSTTKGAINQITRELAVEWAKHNIRVNAIMPAQVHTDYLEKLLNNPDFDASDLIERIKSGIPLGRMGRPEDLVGPVVFLASEAAAFITGVLLPIDGGNLAFNACGSLDCVKS